MHHWQPWEQCCLHFHPSSWSELADTQVRSRMSWAKMFWPVWSGWPKFPCKLFFHALQSLLHGFLGSIDLGAAEKIIWFGQNLLMSRECWGRCVCHSRNAADRWLPKFGPDVGRQGLGRHIWRKFDPKGMLVLSQSGNFYRTNWWSPCLQWHPGQTTTNESEISVDCFPKKVG